ncbi:MAG: pitrilysin family protein [Planctomycetota bacterium]
MIEAKETIDLGTGLRLHLFQTPLFKTTTIKIFIHLPLDENATANALLVRVLGRGCRKYPTMRKISIFLDSLYGAIFGADISKIGEHHIIEFFFEFVSQRFLPKHIDNTYYALNFLKQIIFNPCLTAGRRLQDREFRSDYFSQEQEKLKDIIKSVYDDKISYADERCIQEMCKDEPYRIYEYGEIDKIDKISPEYVLNHYRDKILKSPMDIFIAGPKGINRVKGLVSNIFNSQIQKSKMQPQINTDKHRLNSLPILPPTKKERLIKENDEIDQSKLVLGCRTYTTWNDKEIFGLMMASGILGGFSHSKLFRYVREKAGLAYYVNSALEKTKGLMFIRAGIDPNKFDAALKIIKEQLYVIQSGDISDEEINNTRSGIINRLKSIEDNASSFIDYNMELSINNRHDTLKELKEQFMDVNKKDIASAAQKIKVDTIYLLNPTIIKSPARTERSGK